MKSCWDAERKSNGLHLSVARYPSHSIRKKWLEFQGRDLWGVVSQQGNHQTLKQRSGGIISPIYQQQTWIKPSRLSIVWPVTHHDGPLPVLGFVKDQRTSRVENLIIHLFCLPGEAVKEGPVWFGHTSGLKTEANRLSSHQL